MLHTKIRRAWRLSFIAGSSLCLMLTGSFSGAPVAQTQTPVFINEFHYDNAGTDSGEFVEIAGPAGTDVSGWRIVRYNGANGQQYTTPAASPSGSDTFAAGTSIPNTCNGFGVLVVNYLTDGLQNGSPDGLALVNASGTVVQFLSYEGTFTAQNGPAAGQASVDVGVSEPGNVNGTSVHLTGTGDTYEDFTWSIAAAHTSGACNTGQTFTGGQAAPAVIITQSGGSTAVTEGGATDSYTIALATTPASAVTVTASVADGQVEVDAGAGFASSVELVFTAANAPQTITVQAVNDTIAEPSPHQSTIVHTVSSEDSVYAALSVPSVSVQITDNDTVAPSCSGGFTPIPTIQGSGAASPLTGQIRTTRGVVIADYESGGTAGTLQGFYIQDPDGDGDPATSDGVFVFNGNNNSVSLGDLVLVTGPVSEFQELTELTATTIEHCGTGAVMPTDISFPVPSSTYLERYEGMLVRVPQTLYVTEHFQLGRFGQVVLSAGGRLPQPTNITSPGPNAQALQNQNDLRKIILDDTSQLQNPDPIVFGRGGQPLSASNTLRGGDTISGLTGVMTYTWAGNSASGNAYRIRPTGAPDDLPMFTAANERPDAFPVVGGTVRVAGMNLLNFFNTFDNVINGVDTQDNCRFGTLGGAADCRGADTPAEFERQWPKTVAAILSIDADIIGINEIENDGYGSDSAIQFLVDRLNADPTTGPGTYAFIDVDANTGQIDALGDDAIKVGMLYKPAAVTPVGETAALNSVEFVNGGDNFPRSRPSLAQAWRVNATGAIFIVDINHLKSKGSACNAPDAGDGQGNCNQVRVNAATALVNWLASDPTGTGDPDILLIGDYNSYAKEDPIAVIEGAGFTNLVQDRIGADGYSYVFDGQWGYLDHALASPSMAPQVTGVVEYHINADEPSVLDYNTDFKSANQVDLLYAADKFRVSDHDPVVVGLNPTAPADVTSSLSLTFSGFALNRVTGRFAQRVTITNNGASPITGPFTLVLDSLTGGALFAAEGTTQAVPPLGSPYVTVSTGDLLPNASVSVTLEFDRTGVPSYVARVIAGAGVR